MKKKSEPDYDNVKIIHIMADGSMRESLEGYDIPPEKLPLTAREILRKMLLEKPCP